MFYLNNKKKRKKKQKRRFDVGSQEVHNHQNKNNLALS